MMRVAPAMMNPDRWVLLYLKDSEGQQFYKIFSGDYGRGLSGDTWRTSSQIIKVEPTTSGFIVDTESGSQYILEHENYLMSHYMMQILDQFRVAAKKGGVQIDLIENANKWLLDKFKDK